MSLRSLLLIVTVVAAAMALVTAYGRFVASS